jgi:hypothetical protein
MLSSVITNCTFRSRARNRSLTHAGVSVRFPFRVVDDLTFTADLFISGVFTRMCMCKFEPRGSKRDITPLRCPPSMDLYAISSRLLTEFVRIVFIPEGFYTPELCAFIHREFWSREGSKV